MNIKILKWLNVEILSRVFEDTILNIRQWWFCINIRYMHTYIMSWRMGRERLCISTVYCIMKYAVFDKKSTNNIAHKQNDESLMQVFIAIFFEITYFNFSYKQIILVLQIVLLFVISLHLFIRLLKWNVFTFQYKIWKAWCIKSGKKIYQKFYWRHRVYLLICRVKFWWNKSHESPSNFLYIYIPLKILYN